MRSSPCPRFGTSGQKRRSYFISFLQLYFNLLFYFQIHYFINLLCTLSPSTVNLIFFSLFHTT
ncbi:hypothetical protein Lalb_Chr05g0216011 [Lupinus albus]|uniref:Uncharacterized protein n=1 Tax=Lupinus albus TaxID=3870 RepID=A0A6A4QIJ3_LUPAL|nr:hypothetical protein Lalb_Chr05g0216011 [Lupinus albus]